VNRPFAVCQRSVNAGVPQHLQYLWRVFVTGPREGGRDDHEVAAHHGVESARGRDGERRDVLGLQRPTRRDRAHAEVDRRYAFFRAVQPEDLDRYAELEDRDGLDGAQFVIRNPNATTTCGCGSSFTTA